MKKYLALALALIMVLSLAACGSSKEETAAPTETTTEPTVEPITLKMHFVDPETAPYVQGGLKIAELVKEATNGQIEIEVLSGGSLGGERDTVELAMDNSLDIATCANSVMTNFIPEMGILDQAYLWKNADEAHAAVDGALGDLIKEAAEALPEGEDRTCLEKALSWSNAVNKSIVALPAELKIPFEGARDGLEASHKIADVAVVSSANRGAVEEEWSKHGLLDHVDILLAQDVGSKAHCIAEMLKFGYAKENVLMVGDAPGDCDAAEKNGVHYYPILVNHEKESWDEAIAVAFGKLQSGTYAPYGSDKKQEFLRNLGG